MADKHVKHIKKDYKGNVLSAGDMIFVVPLSYPSVHMMINSDWNAAVLPKIVVFKLKVDADQYIREKTQQ